MATRVRSFSKINLGLRIGPARADGFHGLATMYQTVGLHDVVTVRARRAAATRIVLRTAHPRVPTDARNTVWQMVERALGAAGVRAEVEVELEKRLPVQGGMGAGSANAAAALLGLERELLLGGEGLGLGGAERLRVASEVGSDVPLFLVGGSVLGMGRGEQVSPLPDLVPDGGDGGLACVVAVPRVGVSTPMAFRRWDGWAAERAGAPAGELTAAPVRDTLLELNRILCSALVGDGRGTPEATGISDRPRPAVAAAGSEGGQAAGGRADRALEALESLVRTGIENDFEEVVFSFHPSLRETKRHLMGEETEGQAVYAALSGSGSALFGLYRSERDAEAAQRRVQEAGTDALRTQTLSRARYWREIFPHEAGPPVAEAGRLT